MRLDVGSAKASSCGAESDLTGLQSVGFDILPKGYGRGQGHARLILLQVVLYAVCMI